MVCKVLSGDKDWGTVYAILVNEYEVMRDRRRSELDPSGIEAFESLRRIIDELAVQGVRLTKEVPVIDIVSSQIVEMIAIQACNIYSVRSHMDWADMEVRPTFEENWFWDNFNDMVDEAVMNLKGAVVGWVTVEYEEGVEEILESHSTRVG